MPKTRACIFLMHGDETLCRRGPKVGVVRRKLSGMIEAARFTFSGRMVCDSFTEFALHRARRLDLEIDIGRCDTRSATLSVRGQQDLVDAFEMACSLGPYDCIILDIERSRTA